MSEDIQQTNWLILIIIVALTTAPGWYLYYDAYKDSERQTEINQQENRRLEQQLATLRSNLTTESIDWKQRYQNAEEVLSSTKTQLAEANYELERARTTVAAIKQAAKKIKFDQTDLSGALEESKKANIELSDEIVALRNREVELEQVLNNMQNELEAARKKSQSMFQENLALKLKINQQSAMLEKKSDQTEAYKEQNFHYLSLNKQLAEQQQRLQRELEQLTQVLSKEIKEKEVQLFNLPDDSAVIRLQSKILFDSASAKIKDSAKPALDKIAQTLEKFNDKKISVEGHTDALQIIGQAEWYFISNWELSAARAAAAVRYLLYSNKNLKPEQMQVVGRGAYYPVADNATPDGRQLNRRIEIHILPKNPDAALIQ